jgi:tRNA threonylcarbamoyladenosine biosynthesis protein TsaE
MPILHEQTLDFLSHSPEQTQRYGVRLGELLVPGDVICLAGPLGAGKTSLANGVGRGFGIAEPLTSPTFTLMNEYRRAGDGRVLVHVDCYRLADAREAEDAGLGDYLDGPYVVAIEWPERVAPLLPPDRLWITLRLIGELKRGLLMEARGARYARLLAEFRLAAFGIK